MRRTMNAEEVAAAVGVSTWAVRQAANRGTTPIGAAALRVGRRVVWSRAAIDRLLGGGDADHPIGHDRGEGEET
jgi:hypothetical protein